MSEITTKQINQLPSAESIGTDDLFVVQQSGVAKKLPGSALVTLLGGKGLTEDVKTALLACFSKVAWTVDDGQDYYDALETALNTKNILGISAVYTQSGTVYDFDTLDSLKSDLVVTASYDDGTTATIPGTSYTLSGTLTAGTSTITVTYSDATTTFTVTVTHGVQGWYYPFNGSLLSSGTEDFGFVGEAVFDTGLFGRQAYSRTAEQSTPVADRQVAIHATGLSKFPAFGGDYTISFWTKTQYNSTGYPFWATYFQSGSSSGNYYTTPTVSASGWSATIADSRNSPANAGYGIQVYQTKLHLRISSSPATGASQDLVVTPPSGFAFTDWHHYAVTRKGTTVRLFIDGTLILTTTANNNTVFAANQVVIGDIFNNTSGSTYTDLQNLYSSGVTIQDLYVAEFCKWESSFDPENITY